LVSDVWDNDRRTKYKMEFTLLRSHVAVEIC
jgi:hypothetical protein